MTTKGGVEWSCVELSGAGPERAGLGWAGRLNETTKWNYKLFLPLLFRWWLKKKYRYEVEIQAEHTTTVETPHRKVGMQATGRYVAKQAEPGQAGASMLVS